MEATPRMHDHALVSRTAAAAGCVLLKNVANTLPLLKQDGAPLRVAVFGAGQIATAFCSAGMTPWRTVNILDGLCASEKLTVDGLLSHKYRTWALGHPDGSQMPLGSVSMEEFAENNDAAVVVITRAAEDGRLQLTDEEEQMLQLVTGAFSRVVLVLNTPGFIELSDAALACGAVLLLGVAGQEAGLALCDVLTGKAVPSGHLAHTWPMRAADFDEACAQPDVFTGYRYFDTFGKDVRYPFGYGLGYGKAELGEVAVGLDGCDVTVSATVENTGERWPVQELVQVYVSHEGHSERPVYFLDCFKKSALLAPGESQTLQLRFPVTELSVFHEDASSYVLEDGYYDIRIGTSCRASCIAGSLRVTRSAVVQAVSPLHMAPGLSRSRTGVQPFTYSGEAEELAAARRCAIRLSDRNLPRRSRRKGREFSGCRPDGNSHTLADVKAGRCNPFTFLAAMDDHSLRELVCTFGAHAPEIPGALGASAGLERYGVPALTIAAGGEGLQLTREVKDEADKTVRHQYCTAFPMASALACSFDPELIRAVGRAIGREMAEYGVDLWLAPGASLQRSPAQPGFADRWSEDPVVSGLCARAMAEGVRPYGAAVLQIACSRREVLLGQSALRDVYGLGFEIAAGAFDACLLPAVTLGGEPVCEDSAIVRSLVVDWRYTGMFLADGERYAAEPTRVALEKSALRILRVILNSKKG